MQAIAIGPARVVCLSLKYRSRFPFQGFLQPLMGSHGDRFRHYPVKIDTQIAGAQPQERNLMGHSPIADAGIVVGCLNLSGQSITTELKRSRTHRDIQNFFRHFFPLVFFAGLFAARTLSACS